MYVGGSPRLPDLILSPISFHGNVEWHLSVSQWTPKQHFPLITMVTELFALIKENLFRNPSRPESYRLLWRTPSRTGEGQQEWTYASMHKRTYTHTNSHTRTTMKDAPSLKGQHVYMFERVFMLPIEIEGSVLSFSFVPALEYVLGITHTYSHTKMFRFCVSCWDTTQLLHQSIEPGN